MGGQRKRGKGASVEEPGPEGEGTAVAGRNPEVEPAGDGEPAPEGHRARVAERDPEVEPAGEGERDPGVGPVGEEAPDPEGDRAAVERDPGPDGTGEEENPRAEASMRPERVFARPVVREEHAESSFTRMVEQQTAKIPSHWFLMGSLASMGASLGLELAGKTRWSRFIGMWAPSLLICGVYNKLVKSLGPL